MRTRTLVARAICALLLAAPLTPTPAHAQLTLRFVAGGLGLADYTDPYASLWNGYLTSGFGASNVSTSSLATDDFSTLAQYDRLVVSVANLSSTLTAAQATALAAYSAAGHRVLLMGEHGPWVDWDNSLASLYGASASATGCAYNPPPWTTSYAPIVQNALTAGITAVRPPCAGAMTGGTQLFTGAFAGLFGPSQNVLLYLDSDTFENYSAGFDDNGRFAQNVAQWLATPTPATAAPEPSAWMLLAGGLLSLALARAARGPDVGAARRRVE